MGGVESTWTVANGVRIHALVSTHEPAERLPAVFVHGIGVASPYMVPTIVRLGPSHRSYAVDLPGFGKSEKPRVVLDVEGLADALADWLEARAIERVALVGNSFGCQVAVDVAVRHAARVERLALLGPTTDPEARTALRQLARWLRTSPRERPSQLPLLVRDYARAGLRRPLRTFRFALRDRLEEKLPQVEMPTLVVRGEHDAIVPERWAEDVRRLLPRGRLVVIPGAAHAVNFNSPGEVAELLRAFFRKP